MAEGYESKFKVGDIVELKSGGPEMTVSWIGESFGSLKVQCEWFLGNKSVKVSHAAFDPRALKLIARLNDS